MLRRRTREPLNGSEWSISGFTYPLMLFLISLSLKLGGHPPLWLLGVPPLQPVAPDSLPLEGRILKQKGPQRDHLV